MDAMSASNHLSDGPASGDGRVVAVGAGDVRRRGGIPAREGDTHGDQPVLLGPSGGRYRDKAVHHDPRLPLVERLGQVETKVLDDELLPLLEEQFGKRDAVVG